MTAGKYNNEAARELEQLRRMKSLAERNVCVFCPENIQNETTTPIEIETDHWFVKKNDFPYERTKLHLMLISKKHVTTISELSKSAQTEFLQIVAEVERKYHLTSYAIGMRSGDMDYNAASVEHLHAHIVVGDKDNPDPEPIRFKMSSRPKSS
jgi:ATP adenylyltransferase